MPSIIPPSPGTPHLVRPLIQANTADSGTVQQGGQIVGLDDGGYVILYNDQSPDFTSGQTIVGQRFNAFGNKVGGELRVSAFDDGDDSVVSGSSITKLHNGNIAFAYTDLFQGNNDIWVRVLNPALGVVRDDAIDTGSGQTKNASITSFADGSYAVSYTLDNGGGNTDVLARIVSATGAVGAPITVRDNGTMDADFSQLATLSNNNFVLAYQQHSGAAHSIAIFIGTPGGATITHHAVFGANDYADETDPDVAALVGGGFVVGWTDAAGDASGQGVRMSIYDNAGVLVAGDIQINTTTTGAQNEVSLVALQDGGFVGTWEDDFSGLVRGQRFDARGHQIGGEFVVKTYSTGEPSDSHDSALLADGRFAYALGDFNAGDSDVTTSIWSPKTLLDFNADGFSDILWQHDDGTPAIWLMNGVTGIGGGVMGNPGAAWHIKSAADFNGDGKADILWQNDDGTPAIWLMNGTTGIGGGVMGNPGAGWHIKAAADFNGDGKADILWQYDDGTPAIWLMDGTNGIGGRVMSNLGAAWHIKDAADFNGDGKADILWQDDDGTPVVWLMNGTDGLGGGALDNLGAAWHAKVAADFNGDGKADVLWQNDDGTPAISLMNGVVRIGGGVMGNPGAAWHIKDAADYNGDGKADILWQHDDGTPAIWFMDGTNGIGGGVMGNPGAAWHLI